MTGELERRAERLSSELRAFPVMAVLRGLSPEETVRRATIAWNLGVRVVEVPIESPAADASLRAAIRAGAERGMDVGAGTIVSAERLAAAIELGAAYAVSPGLDERIVARAHAAGLPIVPGVATASEILAARTMGLTWVKAFPASVLGPDWIRAMLGPFPDLAVIATGGIDARNADAFLRSGAAVAGLSGAFVDDEQSQALHRLIARDPIQERVS